MGTRWMRTIKEAIAARRHPDINVTRKMTPLILRDPVERTDKKMPMHKTERADKKKLMTRSPLSRSHREPWISPIQGPGSPPGSVRGAPCDADIPAAWRFANKRPSGLRCPDAS